MISSWNVKLHVLRCVKGLWHGKLSFSLRSGVLCLLLVRALSHLRQGTRLPALCVVRSPSGDRGLGRDIYWPIARKFASFCSCAWAGNLTKYLFCQEEEEAKAGRNCQGSSSSPSVLCVPGGSAGRGAQARGQGLFRLECGNVSPPGVRRHSAGHDPVVFHQYFSSWQKLEWPQAAPQAQLQHLGQVTSAALHIGGSAAADPTHHRILRKKLCCC